MIYFKIFVYGNVLKILCMVMSFGKTYKWKIPRASYFFNYSLNDTLLDSCILYYIILYYDNSTITSNT